MPEPLLWLEDPNLNGDVHIMLQPHIVPFSERFYTHKALTVDLLAPVVTNALSDLKKYFHFRPLFELYPCDENLFVRLICLGNPFIADLNPVCCDVVSCISPSPFIQH